MTYRYILRVKMRIICEFHYLLLSLFLLIFACELLKRQFDYVLFLNKQNAKKTKKMDAANYASIGELLRLSGAR